ncbi:MULTISPECIES: lipocalin family protein [unclassified Chryseobacterium]|uniref:lipocalin family protein n=1 Tax=unclassified Chryseobacterium TaxID=2593645 RepID=UPI000E0C4F90|nr:MULTISPECIES: lipocalin family protein [unclassified Chryseobacterium]MDQ1859101.1 lipocalin family protein [Chryseobacterium sp. WLY505]
MKNKIILTLLVCFGLFNVLASCSSMPEKAQPVERFDVNRYLGTWYEIARFDYRFEKDLDNAIAQYSLNADGNVNVVNSGYNFKKNKWVSVNGTAKFRGEKNVAALKVSFFGPFYAGYNVVALEEYQYALIAGKNLDYLWILSREKNIPENVKQKFISKAQEIGYDTSKLIWVKQNKKSPFDK